LRVRPKVSGPDAVRGRELRREIGDHGIEQRKSRLRHAQPAAGVHGDDAFLAQNCDAGRIERASRQLLIALRIDTLGEPQSHQQELISALFAVEHIIERATSINAF
jgi:hypothetical protein